VFYVFGTTIGIISLWSKKVPILGIAYEVKYNVLFKNHVRLPFSPFVRDIVSATKLSVLIKFSVAFLLTSCPGDVGFVKISELGEKRRKDSHNLLRGLNECVPALSTLFAPFMKISASKPQVFSFGDRLASKSVRYSRV
jgi:hypothetical protein